MGRRAILVALVLVLISLSSVIYVLGPFGGSASYGRSGGYKPAESGDLALEVAPTQTAAPTPGESNPQRLKKDYYITIQYEDPLGRASKLKVKVAELNGYVVSENLERDEEEVVYCLTFRVPNTAENENRMGEFFRAYRIKSLRLETEDVTSQYNQIMAEIESLEAEKAKLMEFYNVSKDVDDLIMLENRISSINSRLNYLYLRKDYYEKVTDYIAYHVTVESNEKPSFKLETHFMERIYTAIGVLVEILEMAVALLWCSRPWLSWATASRGPTTASLCTGGESSSA